MSHRTSAVDGIRSGLTVLARKHARGRVPRADRPVGSGEGARSGRPRGVSEVGSDDWAVSTAPKMPSPITPITARAATGIRAVPDDRYFGGRGVVVGQSSPPGGIRAPTQGARSAVQSMPQPGPNRLAAQAIAENPLHRRIQRHVRLLHCHLPLEHQRLHFITCHPCHSSAFSYRNISDGLGTPTLALPLQSLVAPQIRRHRMHFGRPPG